MARYNAGETLASIAKTYDCSPPAISYVVSRSRGRELDGEPPPKAPITREVQLVKATAAEPAAPNGAQSPPEPTAPPTNGFAANDASERDPMRSGIVRPPPPQPTAAVEHRPTLHLALGNSSAGNGNPPPVETSASHAVQPAAERSFSEAATVPYAPPPRRVDGERREGGGPFIDRDLRARVDSDITAFLAAFDAALGEDTQENRAALREATDRLLRAGARTRIELERLEARVPLPPRAAIGRNEPSWRPR